MTTGHAFCCVGFSSQYTVFLTYPHFSFSMVTNLGECRVEVMHNIALTNPDRQTVGSENITSTGNAGG